MKNFNTISLKCITYFSLTFFISTTSLAQNQNFVIDNSFPYLVNYQTLGRNTIGGDTIFISSARTNPLKFQFTNGSPNAPLVVINKGGQVKIDSPNSYSWGAITFENCKFIKISGAGHPEFKYGFTLSADECGLAFSELSSDCEAEFIKISHDGFFGILAKKNYEGNPPFPYPEFNNLIIHDCFIENVVEGMYLGETKSPGMEFKHVKIYNNIVRNTGRESIQIANMVEDIAIYNNTLLNAGLENTPWHTNLLQIGDNSVVNAYNNILEGAPSSGINMMGKGQGVFTNNYIASNTGIFLDNRIFSDSLSPINIKQNYFRSTSGNQVIKNYNEINYITVEDNRYDTDIVFYLNQSGNSNNYSVLNNALTSVPQIQFQSPLTNDYSLASGMATEYQSIGAPGGPEYFDPVPEIITITPNMVTDLVSVGSINSPLLLFDEQHLNINANEHATGNSWKPHNNMNNAPYHVIVDLGQNYFISEINLHDMNDSNDFTVEYANETTWTTLFVDPCNNYNVWNKHITNVSTQFLRLTLNDNVYANINEIIIYGYPQTLASKQIIITPNMVTDQVTRGSINSPLLLFDEQNLNIQNGDQAISNSWKPYYTMNNAPYYVVIDLGKNYHISEINLHDMNGTHDFTIEHGTPSSWTLLLTDPLDKYQIWNKHLTNISTRYLRLSTPNSPYAAVNEIIVYGYPLIMGSEIVSEPEIENSQIIITSNMVTDQVLGGSVNSPLLLFDEQTINYQINTHPTSNSWKPDYTMKKPSYHAILDLGQEYHISEINLHDMNSTFNFTVEYGNLVNWTTLFIDPCDTFNTWSPNITNVTTRYLRFSMYQDINACVNEILIFGHPISNVNNTSKNQKKSNSIVSENVEIETRSTNQIKLYPNPIDNDLNLLFPLKMIGKNSLQIKDLLGKTIYTKDIYITEAKINIELNNSDLNRLTPGYYFLYSQHESGISQTLKFVKK